MPTAPLRRIVALTGGTVLVTVAVLLAPSPAAAASCQGANLAPGAQSPSDAMTAVVCEINQERRSRDARALDIDRALARAGDRHAADMVRRGYFSHVSPSGRTMTTRLRAAGYLPDGPGWAAGEVLAWGTGARATPGAIVAAWMHSGAHRQVLLNPRYREIGVGIAPGNPVRGSAGATYAAELGVIRR